MEVLSSAEKDRSSNGPEEQKFTIELRKKSRRERNSKGRKGDIMVNESVTIFKQNVNTAVRSLRPITEEFVKEETTSDDKTYYKNSIQIKDIYNKRIKPKVLIKSKMSKLINYKKLKYSERNLKDGRKGRLISHSSDASSNLGPILHKSLKIEQMKIRKSTTPHKNMFILNMPSQPKSNFKKFVDDSQSKFAAKSLTERKRQLSNDKSTDPMDTLVNPNGLFFLTSNVDFSKDDPANAQKYKIDYSDPDNKVTQTDSQLKFRANYIISKYKKKASESKEREGKSRNILVNRKEHLMTPKPNLGVRMFEEPKRDTQLDIHKSVRQSLDFKNITLSNSKLKKIQRQTFGEYVASSLSKDQIIKELTMESAFGKDDETLRVLVEMKLNKLQMIYRLMKHTYVKRSKLIEKLSSSDQDSESFDTYKFNSGYLNKIKKNNNKRMENA